LKSSLHCVLLEIQHEVVQDFVEGKTRGPFFLCWATVDSMGNQEKASSNSKAAGQQHCMQHPSSKAGSTTPLPKLLDSSNACSTEWTKSWTAHAHFSLLSPHDV